MVSLASMAEYSPGESVSLERALCTSLEVTRAGVLWEGRVGEGWFKSSLTSELLAPHRTPSGFEKQLSPGLGKMEATELRAESALQWLTGVHPGVRFSGESALNWPSEPHGRA